MTESNFVIVVKLKVMQKCFGCIGVSFNPAGLTSSAQAVFARETLVCIFREDGEENIVFSETEKGQCFLSVMCEFTAPLQQVKCFVYDRQSARPVLIALKEVIHLTWVCLRNLCTAQH